MRELQAQKEPGVALPWLGIRREGRLEERKLARPEGEGAKGLDDLGMSAARSGGGRKCRSSFWRDDANLPALGRRHHGRSKDAELQEKLCEGPGREFAVSLLGRMP